MFTIQHTDLHPGFQSTIAEIIDYLHAVNDESFLPNRPSFLEELTGWEEPEELITANAYAIPLLEQHPEYLRPNALHTNKSEHALSFFKTLRLPKYETCLLFHETPNIDTYLQDACLEHLNFRMLSSNPHAFPFLRKHLDKVDWSSFSTNPEAIDLLEYYSDRISYHHLSANTNPRAIALLRNNLDQVCWERLSQNPSDAAIDLLEEYPEHIDYTHLSANRNDRAIDLLVQQGIDKVVWRALSANPCQSAVALLQQYPEKIKWSDLSSYAQTKQQFELLRNNPHKIKWGWLCLNNSPLVLELLLAYPNKIKWWYALEHQNVFETITTYDYAGIRSVRRELHEEFHARMGHPSRMLQWKGWGSEEGLMVAAMEEETDEDVEEEEPREDFF